MEPEEPRSPLGTYAKIQLDRCSVHNIRRQSQVGQANCRHHKGFAQRLISVRGKLMQNSRTFRESGRTSTGVRMAAHTLRARLMTIVALVLRLLRVRNSF